MRANENGLNGGYEQALPNYGHFVRAIMPDKRQQPRMQVELRAFAPEGLEYEVLDISAGGIRIAAPSLVWPGNEIELLINAPRLGLVRARGRVLSFVPSERGVAMRLVFVRPSSRLRTFLADVLDSQGHLE